MIPDPGYDLRTLITAAIVIPVVTFTAIGTARMFGRLFRRWGAFTGKVIRSTVVEAISGALTPRFDHLEAKFDRMAEENLKAHTDVATRLASHDGRLDSLGDQLDAIKERLDTLESRRRDDRPRRED